MREAVVVSTARTGIGKAYRGALNATKSPTLVAHVLNHAIERAGIEAGEIEDFVLGTVLAAGTAGMNLARNGGVRRGRAGQRIGPDRGSPVRVGTDGNRDGGQADHRRRHGCRRGRRPGKHFRRAGRATSPGSGRRPIPTSSPRRRTPICRCCRRPSSWRGNTASAARRRTHTRCSRSSEPQPPSRPAVSTTRSCRSPPPCW